MLTSFRLHFVEHEKPAGETYDYSGQYRIFRHFRPRSTYEPEEISFITWSTLETLPNLANFTKEWDGEVSCSIFVNFSEASLVAGLIDKFSKCHRLSNVAFHLVYEADSHLQTFVRARNNHTTEFSVS